MKMCMWVALVALLFSAIQLQAQQPAPKPPPTPPDPFAPGKLPPDPFGPPGATPAPPAKKPETKVAPPVAPKPVRKAVDAPAPKNGAAAPRTNEEEIKLALNAPAAGIEFFEVSLQDVIKHLNHEYDGTGGKPRIFFVLDERALKEASIKTDLQISKSIVGVKLKSALNQLLDRHKLAWIIKDECLVITTQEKAANEYAQVTYPVADLAAFKDDRGGYQDFQELVTTLRETVAPTSWKPLSATDAKADSSKALATITVSQSSGSLVVLQNWAVHQEIEDLLATLRATKKQQTLEGPVRRPRTATGKPETIEKKVVPPTK